MDDLINPQTLEYVVAIVTGASIPLGLGYIGYKIRERLFELDITASLYNDGTFPQLDEKPTFWNIGRLSPFNPNSKFYKNKPVV
jgi:hypothetical protein